MRKGMGTENTPDLGDYISNLTLCSIRKVFVFPDMKLGRVKLGGGTKWKFWRLR